MDLPTFDLHSIPDGSTVFVVSSDTDQTTRLIQEILRVKVVNTDVNVSFSFKGINHSRCI